MKQAIFFNQNTRHTEHFTDFKIISYVIWMYETLPPITHLNHKHNQVVVGDSSSIQLFVRVPFILLFKQY